MATLTPEQTDFLKSHHIPTDKTFDASGLSSKDYKAKMKGNGTLVAYGVPPCPKGHTLRNKQANCLQCNPHAVASIKRQATGGQLYIATAIVENLLKISTTENREHDTESIANQLNQSHHANIHDWQVVYLADINSIGEIENQLQNHFATQQVKCKLSPDSKAVKASEIFNIDIHEVLDVLKTWKIEPKFHNDNKIAEAHNYYAQQSYEKQQAQQRLAEEQAQRVLAEENAKTLAKQQAQQQLMAEQEKAKHAKLERKRQKHAQLEQQRQQKLEKHPLQLAAPMGSNAKITTTDLQTGRLSKTQNATLPTATLWQKLTPNQWLMVGVGIFIAMTLIVLMALR